MPDTMKEKEKRKRRPEHGTVIGVVIAGFIALLTIVMVLARGRQQIIPLDGTATAIQLTNAEIARLLTGTADAQMTIVARTQQAALATTAWVETDTAPMTVAVQTQPSVLATQTAYGYETYSAAATDSVVLTSTMTGLETIVYTLNPDKTAAAGTVAAIGDMLATYNASVLLAPSFTPSPTVTASPTYTASPTRAPTITPSGIPSRAPTRAPTLTRTPSGPDRPDCPMLMNTREDYDTEIRIERALTAAAFDLPFAPNGVSATAYGEDYHCGDPALTPTPIFYPLVPSFSIMLRLTEAEYGSEISKGNMIYRILWTLRDVTIKNADMITIVFSHETSRVEWKMSYQAAYEALNAGLNNEALYNAGKITEFP